MNSIEFTTNYLYALGSYLNEKDIKWKHISTICDDNLISNKITIILGNAEICDVFELAIDFAEWKKENGID